MRHRNHAISADAGFTLVELMIVALIIGVLVSVALPTFFSAQASAAERTCFSNQRTVEGAVQTWLAAEPLRSIDDLVGVVNAAHPLVAANILRAPSCPAAPSAADFLNPTPAEGAYTLDAGGVVADCTFGDLGPHGHY